MLKTCWDTLFKKHPSLVFVVCGSVSSWIEKNIINSKDFWARLSLTIHLEELPLQTLPAFWQKHLPLTNPQEIQQILSVTGGVPRYLEEIDYQKSAEQNIKRLCFTPVEFLSMNLKGYLMIFLKIVTLTIKNSKNPYSWQEDFL